jgi:hypothetical protein
VAVSQKKCLLEVRGRWRKGSPCKNIGSKKIQNKHDILKAVKDLKNFRYFFKNFKKSESKIKN